MTPELAALAVAALVQFAQLLDAGRYLRRQGRMDYQMTPRDEPRPLTGKAGRADRAMRNHTENLVLFTAAVVVVTLAGQGTFFTATCAWLYVAARILYVPAYIEGWVPWRSYLFGVGWVATLLMILAAFV